MKTHNIALEIPINDSPTGRISKLVLRTLYEQELSNFRHHNIFIFPIGEVERVKEDNRFNIWIWHQIINGRDNFDRDIASFKISSLEGAANSFSRKINLLSFYDLDSPTVMEMNTTRQTNTYFSSKYANEVFNKNGANTKYMPLAFDSFNFKQLEKKRNDGRIIFNIIGEFENKKHQLKVIQSWIKKYANDPKYALQCCICRPELSQEKNQEIIAFLLQGKDLPFNVNFYPYINNISNYNGFLNSADIIIGMSGAESFYQAEFHSVAIGKHSIILNAHCYKDWANDENSTLVEPSNKIQAYDGMSLFKGLHYNQGNIFDFNEEELIEAYDKAINKVKNNKINTSGLKLQEEFSKEKFVNNIISIL